MVWKGVHIHNAGLADGLLPSISSHISQCICAVNFDHWIKQDSGNTGANKLMLH